MAEKTNVEMAVCIADITSMCGFGSDGALVPSFLRARLSAAAAISFSYPVWRCCFRALIHFMRSAARPSQDIVSMSTSFIFPTRS